MWGHQVRRVHQTETSKAYTGWTRQILVDSNHRWRFQRFLKGWLVEQVSYYADGTADHHFHTDTLGRNAAASACGATTASLISTSSTTQKAACTADK